MENLQIQTVQPEENNLAVPIPETDTTHGIEIYNGASTLQLTVEESGKLSEPFHDEEYEIRPDGFLYVPQALIRGRFNKVIGAGQWSIILLRDRFEAITDKSNKLYYDGALLIRGKFASRSTGEATYFTNNPNQSWASALESGKTDCMVRCAKDLGIALEVYQPAFVRRWQKTYAKRVWTKEKNGDTKVMWRRVDVDPFHNETGDFTHKPSVPTQTPKTVASPVTEEWKAELANRKTPEDLVSLYNQNKKVVDAWPELKEAFKKRETELKKP